MKPKKIKRHNEDFLRRKVVSPPPPPTMQNPPSTKDIISAFMDGGTEKLQAALIDERIACTMFHMFLDAILSDEKYKNKSFAEININVSVFMYLQLLKYWGPVLQELMVSDPIYSRIYIDSSLILPIKIYYR